MDRLSSSANEVSRPVSASAVAAGFAFEAVGDLQLRRFLADPANAGQARSKGAAYADYVHRTSGFIPWPPR